MFRATFAEKCRGLRDRGLLVEGRIPEANRPGERRVRFPRTAGYFQDIQATLVGARGEVHGTLKTGGPKDTDPRALPYYDYLVKTSFHRMLQQHAGKWDWLVEKRGYLSEVVRYKFEVFRLDETGWGVVWSIRVRFAQRWQSCEIVSQIYPNYCMPNLSSVPPLGFAMDVSKMRNVACYMSHVPVRTVFVQLVLTMIMNNVCSPDLWLFWMENIPPFKELSIDYWVC
nr:histone-lysine N-methyltransferase family member SUVH9-like [Ipomoea batatas]